MRVLVQKFGGTSVHTPHARCRALAHVMRAVEAGYRVLVVVSAMGRSGHPYATDTLLALARGVWPTGPPDELDLLLSCGELIACVVVANSFRRGGLDRVVVLSGPQAGIITDDGHGDARIVEVRPETVLHHLHQGYVVVVAGFQGTTRSGKITTLGRGGSDTTAAALAAAVGAELIEIYTDVDGVRTADPRVVPEAGAVPHLTYDEAWLLASSGMRIVHPRAIRLAATHRLPIRVRGNFSEDEGTLIDHRHPSCSAPSAVKAIAHRERVSLAYLIYDDRVGSRQKPTQALRGLSCGMVDPSGCMLCTGAYPSGAWAEALATAGWRLALERPCAEATAVGYRLAEEPELPLAAYRDLRTAAVETLAMYHTPLYIRFAVAAADLTRALRVLHRTFGLTTQT